MELETLEFNEYEYQRLYYNIYPKYTLVSNKNNVLTLKRDKDNKVFEFKHTYRDIYTYYLFQEKEFYE